MDHWPAVGTDERRTIRAGDLNRRKKKRRDRNGRENEQPTAETKIVLVFGVRIVELTTRVSDRRRQRTQAVSEDVQKSVNVKTEALSGGSLDSLVGPGFHRPQTNQNSPT